MNHTHTIRAIVSEFALPPIEDVLVMGRRSPIGHVAMGRALDLISTTSYQHLAVEDDVIGDLIVRQAVLRRLDAQELIHFVLEHVKPFMGDDEIVHLRLDVQTHLEVEVRAR